MVLITSDAVEEAPTDIRAFEFISYASQDEFQAAVKAMYSHGQPPPKEPRRRAEFLVRRLLGTEPEIEVLTYLKEWLTGVFP